ncbi:O-methyltransferase [Brevibacillus sp. GCM10020057]|uniref:O-methyltransferase n=1 Tax=Brevibacillus sp. GCM10020057 TaxID=3317327 RepID=UPI0036367B8E
MIDKKFARSLDDVMEELIKKLIDYEYIFDDSHFNPENFIRFKKSLLGNINVPSTTISPIMERFLFACSSSYKVRNIVVLGSYFGYALLWLAAGVSNESTPRVVGIDLNEEACLSARQNVRRIGLNGVEIICGDAFTVIDNFENNKFDLLFLDVEKEGSKSAYYPLLEKWLPKLRTEAIILAHDSSVPKFAEDFKKYHEFVRDTKRFRKSVSLPLDKCGIEVTRMY